MDNSAGSFEKSLEELIRRVVREEVKALAEASPTVPVANAATPAATPAASAGPGLRAVSQAVAAVVQPTAQAEILAAVLRGALALAGRCVLFIRRGENLSAWRAEGYSPQTASALRAVTVAATQPGLFRDLCETQQAICRQRVPGSLPLELEQALGSALGPHWCLLPVVVQGKVVAALYSDAGGDAGSEEMSGLEILARVAGLSLETAAVRAASRSGAAGAPAAAATATEAPPEPVRWESAAPESVAVESAAAASAVASPIAVAEEAPARGSFVDVFPAAAAPADLPPPPDMDSLPEEERESHRKAHRFARVAVQDLLFYHREKIAAARRDKNLFEVLKDDIEKARENYRKRFGETPARSFDYLHYEMVSKLAGNDPSALGSQYPGSLSG